MNGEYTKLITFPDAIKAVLTAITVIVTLQLAPFDKKQVLLNNDLNYLKVHVDKLDRKVESKFDKLFEELDEYVRRDEMDKELEHLRKEFDQEISNLRRTRADGDSSDLTKARNLVASR